MTPSSRSMLETWSWDISASGDSGTWGSKISCSFFAYAGCLVSSNRAQASVVLVVSLAERV